MNVTNYLMQNVTNLDFNCMDCYPDSWSSGLIISFRITMILLIIIFIYIFSVKYKEYKEGEEK